MGTAVMQGVDFLILRIRAFKLRNFQIKAVPTWKDFDLLILKNRDISS